MREIALHRLQHQHLLHHGEAFKLWINPAFASEMPTVLSIRHSRPLLPPFVTGAGLCLGLCLAASATRAAEQDIVGRYVAKDAEFVIEKASSDYKMQYFGKCLREGEPFEFYTNGKARRINSRSFAISVVTSRVPSCARFAPLDGQDHILEQSAENPDLWRFRKTEPTWLTKQAFLREK